MSKYALLIEGLVSALGIDREDFNFVRDIQDLHWYTSNGKQWTHNFTKNKIAPLPDNLPQLRMECYCTTKIKYNCLVRHKPSGRLFVIGSECIKRCKGTLARVCDICNKPNRCVSMTCNTCQKQTKIYEDERAKRCKGTLARVCDICNKRNRCVSMTCNTCQKQTKIYEDERAKRLQAISIHNSRRSSRLGEFKWG